ncbi:MAG TPA: magnesium-transporting ATPase, partial [Ruminococcaceae bacterium]|nr:magnesium-transporting ATPase [Oscillospiraceae bacterium]
TGDGVNDVLALKEADCGVAMKSGGDAARSVADFVLLDSNFSAMIEVLKEGRRVINNIEQVAVLYLVKTIYSTLLSILFTFLPFAYPFTPLQLTPVNLLVVGIPSFFMALRPNYAKPNSQFISNILLNALPAALIVVIDILVVQLAGVAFKLNLIETSTMAVLLIGITGIILLFEISKPLNRRKSLLLSAVVIVFFAFFIIIGHYFSLGTLFSRDVFFYLPLAFSNRYLFIYIKQLIKKILSLINLLAPKFHQKTTPPEI